MLRALLVVVGHVDRVFEILRPFSRWLVNYIALHYMQYQQRNANSFEGAIVEARA